MKSRLLLLLQSLHPLCDPVWLHHQNHPANSPYNVNLIPLSAIASNISRSIKSTSSSVSMQSSTTNSYFWIAESNISISVLKMGQTRQTKSSALSLMWQTPLLRAVGSLLYTVKRGSVALDASLGHILSGSMALQHRRRLRLCALSGQVVLLVHSNITCTRCSFNGPSGLLQMKYDACRQLQSQPQPQHLS
jgi:hypothetical protein